MFKNIAYTAHSQPGSEPVLIVSYIIDHVKLPRISRGLDPLPPAGRGLVPGHIAGLVVAVVEVPGISCRLLLEPAFRASECATKLYVFEIHLSGQKCNRNLKMFNMFFETIVEWIYPCNVDISVD